MARSTLKIFVRNLPEQSQPRGFALRQNLPDGLCHFEPQALAERPERTHQILFQAYTDSATQTFWQEDLWKAMPNPRDHTSATVRRRVRYHSLVGTNAAAFLIAHPSTATTVHSTHWSVMLRRHLDLPVYHDTTPTITCPHCHRRMDNRGDHATKCSHGFGYTHRHNTLRNAIARKIFKPAGLAYNIEVPFLIPDSNLRPADILVQAHSSQVSESPTRPTAYDVTVRSPFTTHSLKSAATVRAGESEVAEKQKHQTLQRNLRNALNLHDTDPVPPLHWVFFPVAFDTYGAASKRTTTFLEDHARKIAYRTTTSYANAKQTIEKHISYSIWSSTAEAILSRLPSSLAALATP